MKFLEKLRSKRRPPGAAAPPSPEVPVFTASVFAVTPTPPASPFAAEGGLRHEMYQRLMDVVYACDLHRFYNINHIREIVQLHAPYVPQVRALCDSWGTARVADDLFKLLLFDPVVIINDGASVVSEERWEDARAGLTYLVNIYSTLQGLQGHGIKVRFFNSSHESDRVKTEADVDALFRRVQPGGGKTSLDKALSLKVGERLLKTPMVQNALTKPLLVITLFDEPLEMRKVKKLLDTYPCETVRWSFGQVGTNAALVAQLRELSSLKNVDCTENYDTVAASLERNGIPAMKPELWILKLAIGPIDETYGGLATDD